MMGLPFRLTVKLWDEFSLAVLSLVILALAGFHRVLHQDRTSVTSP